MRNGTDVRPRGLKFGSRMSGNGRIRFRSKVRANGCYRFWNTRRHRSADDPGGSMRSTMDAWHIADIANGARQQRTHPEFASPASGSSTLPICAISTRTNSAQAFWSPPKRLDVLGSPSSMRTQPSLLKYWVKCVTDNSVTVLTFGFRSDRGRKGKSYGFRGLMSGSSSWLSGTGSAVESSTGSSVRSSSPRRSQSGTSRKILR